MSGTLPWFVARASGLVAWGLLAASVIWGLLMTSKVIRRWAKNAWLLDLHRWLGALALAFTALHVVALMADTYVHFGLASVLVPLASHWHPVAVAWGIASLYLLVAVELTSVLRRWLNRTLWRRAHFLSFPLFVASTLHGLSAGTDGPTPMAIITASLVAGAVAALIAIRLANRSGATRGGSPGPGPRPGSPRPQAPLGRDASRPGPLSHPQPWPTVSDTGADGAESPILVG